MIMAFPIDYSDTEYINAHCYIGPSTTVERWKTIEFGIVSKVLKLLLVNICDKVRGTITILLSVFLSIADTVSDVVVAITLIYSGHYYWGCIVIVVDYLPSWDLLIHNCTSEKWRKFKGVKEKVVTILFLLTSPFATALFNLRWLDKFETADQDTFDFLHHNARMSQLLSGSFESPIQIILLFILYGENKLDSPLTPHSNCVTDRIGRELCFGILPGVISFLSSILTILKGSLEISEGQNWEEKTCILVYASSSFAFRLPSLALLVLFFDEWAIGIILALIIINVLIIFRFNKEKRKEISIFSSTVIATVTPFVASDQANLYQRINIDGNDDISTDNTLNRKRLSSRLTLVTTIILIVCDMVLLFLLMFYESFIFRDDVITIEKKTAIDLILTFLLPMGAINLIVTYIYGTRISRSENQYGNYYGYNYLYVDISSELYVMMKKISSLFVLYSAMLVILTISCLTVTSIFHDNLGRMKTLNKTDNDLEIVLNRNNAACVASSASNSSDCPPNFIQHDNHCYTSPPFFATWYDSEACCNQMGESYNLVIIESAYEYQFLKKKLQYPNNRQEFWIGLIETEERNDFEWVDGSKLTFGAKFYEDPWEVYSGFDKEPNKLGGTDRECVRLDYNIRWADKNCKNLFRFICEGKMLSPNGTSNQLSNDTELRKSNKSYEKTNENNEQIVNNQREEHFSVFGSHY